MLLSVASLLITCFSGLMPSWSSTISVNIEHMFCTVSIFIAPLWDTVRLKVIVFCNMLINNNEELVYWLDCWENYVLSLNRNLSKVFPKIHTRIQKNAFLCSRALFIWKLTYLDDSITLANTINFKFANNIITSALRGLIWGHSHNIKL